LADLSGDEDKLLNVLELFQEPVTTKRILEKVKESGLDECRDSTVTVLMSLKMKGLIHGKPSILARGWVWWRTPVSDGSVEKHDKEA